MDAATVVIVRDAGVYVAVLVTWFLSMVMILRRFQSQTEVMDKLLVAVTFLAMILQALVTYYTTTPSTEVYQKIPITDEGEFLDTTTTTTAITYTIPAGKGAATAGGAQYII